MPSEVLAITAQFFLLREIVPLSKYLPFNGILIKQCARLPHSQTDIFVFAKEAWKKDKWSSNRDEIHFLFRQTYEAMEDKEEQRRFFLLWKRLLESCENPEMLLKDLIESLPKDILEFDLPEAGYFTFAYSIIENGHLAAVAKHFTCLQKLNLSNIHNLTQEG